MKFYIIIHRLLDSFIENDYIKVVRKFDKFIQKLEMTIVNGRRSMVSNYRKFKNLTGQNDEDLVLNSLDKEFEN
jgi:hypothetical protein